MQRQLLALRSRVLVPTLPAASGAPVDPSWVSALNAEVALFGYGLVPEALDALRRMEPAHLRWTRTTVLRELSEATLAHANHATLFRGFPYDTPDALDYLHRRILGEFLGIAGLRPGNHTVLSCGHVIDQALFDVSAFGACPICQEQVPEIDPVDREPPRHAFRRVTQAKPLALADLAYVKGEVEGLLARQSALSPDERDLVRGALPLVSPLGLARPERAFRETLPLLHVAFGDLDYTRSLLSGARDVLRIASYLSDDGADLSLSEDVRFKLTRRRATELLSMLEGLGDVREDLLRDAERWKRFGEHVHPGSARNRDRFPNTAAAFDALRRAPRTIPSFNRAVEARVHARDVDDDLLGLLATRPGEFSRRLDFLLRTAADPDAVNRAFAPAAATLPTARLLGLAKFFEARASGTGRRAFVAKGTASRMAVAEDARPPVPGAALDGVRTVLGATLTERLSRLPPMGRVWLDPRLADLVLPFNKRGDSRSSGSPSKGSRTPLDGAGEVVRAFVHWTGDGVDVDLSVICFDEGLTPVEQVSYTNTKSPLGMVHSGDVQSAPRGASEFVDFEPARLRAAGIRYVAQVVNSFRGQTFDGFPCFTGFMLRDGLTSGAKFEPASVASKVDVSSKATGYVSAAYDVVTGDLLTIDLADVRSGRGMRVDGDEGRFSELMRGVLDLPLTKPTALDVLLAHATARGTVVGDRDAADVAFEAHGLDLDALVAAWVEATGPGAPAEHGDEAAPAAPGM